MTIRIAEFCGVSRKGGAAGTAKAKLEVREGMRNSRCRSGFLVLTVLVALALAGTGLARDMRLEEEPVGSTDARPPAVWTLHNLSNLWSAFLNIGIYGDPWENYPSMEWPGGEGSSYMFTADLWSCQFGPVTSTYPDSLGKWASSSDYGNWELWASEGYPLEKFAPGPVALEETHYGFDDWDPASNEYPYGMRVYNENYGWGTPGYNDFIVQNITITHHPEHGSGEPLDAFIASMKADADCATGDVTECHIDDLVYYDGHAIWCNDPDATFEYIFDDGTLASEQDIYTYQQNPDNSLPEDDPENVWYYYNYMGADDLPDNDVNEDGVSDHFTILFRRVGSDTVWTQNEAGLNMFADGMPENHWEHTVGDTTYHVVPRNMSYIWDGNNPASSADDSGEPELSPPANGFISWRLLDCWIKKADGTIERPIDVFDYPIPQSHGWWNWESDPGSNVEQYDYMWGANPDASGQFSGPEYMLDWVGNPHSPEAITPSNPGPFPIVHDNPIALGYPVFDYRFLLSMGPVNLEEGDSLRIVGGFVIGAGLDGARQSADAMLDAYYRDGGWGVPKLPPTPVLFYEAGDGVVNLEWGANAETYDPLGGYRVYRAAFEPANWTLVETVSPGTLSYQDMDVTNGYPYYYVVCAYDSETDVESTRSNYKQTLEGTPQAVTPVMGTDANWTENVQVVPNPYRGSAAWEQTYFDKIAFTNLPAMCNIHIYTLGGDHVITLEHRSWGGEEGTEFWDLISRNDQEIASGLYIYRVETEQDFVIGKFAVIK